MIGEHDIADAKRVKHDSSVDLNGDGVITAEIIKNDDHEVQVSESKDKEVEEFDEEKWGSRWSFILAAIGSAIGLGNFWRFPFLAYRWGGGAFFIPYLIALIFVGIPLIQLEMALGQVFRRAATQSFGALHPRWRGIGLGASMIAFVIVTYYCAILGWGNVYLIQSFFSPMPWSVYGLTGTAVFEGPSNHFFNNVLQLSPDPLETKLISSSVFAGAFFMWASVWLILWRGAEFISKAVWVTVLLPVFMLIILVIVGGTLEGASKGIKQYIGVWDMSLLSEGDMWVDAFSQIFFSLSLSTGVMSAYAALNPRNADIVKDATIVACCNCFFSFIAGFAVFSIAGFYSVQSGLEFDDPNFNLGGVSLAFITYPSGLSMVGGAGANVLCVLFFVTFYFLGVDSAFSLVEAVVMNWRETKLFGSWSKQEMTLLVCSLGFCITILYCSDIGLYLLDVVDDYASSLGLLVIGYFECLVAGWVYKRDDVASKVGSSALTFFEVGMGGGFLMWCLLIISLPFANQVCSMDGENEVCEGTLPRSTVYGASFGVGLVMMAIGIVASHILAQKRLGGPVKTSAYYLWLHGPESLRSALNEVILEDKPNNWKFTTAWGICLKYIMTPILQFLVIQRITIRAANEGYGGYPWQYQLIGALVMIFIFMLVAVGWCFPKLYQEPARYTE
mmetsp:Transcript_19159/g.28260  ORF Transcript_19159/g.28260 Transcript_19159/m.28260 type:complete len:673 (-) Transcript_19159:46-2064(-)